MRTPKGAAPFFLQITFRRVPELVSLLTVGEADRMGEPRGE